MRATTEQKNVPSNSKEMQKISTDSEKILAKNVNFVLNTGSILCFHLGFHQKRCGVNGDEHDERLAGIGLVLVMLAHGRVVPHFVADCRLSVEMLLTERWPPEIWPMELNALPRYTFLSYLLWMMCCRCFVDLQRGESR